MGSLSAQLTSNPPLWLALMGLLGLTMGSFACVVVLRLPVRLMAQFGNTADLPQANQPNDPNDSHRSRCPNCNHQLRWLDLIPVLSWLALRGQCAHCKQAISKLYIVLELLVCAWFMWCTYAVIAQPLTTLHPTATALAWSMWGTVLLCCLLIDARYMLLPDVLTLPLLTMGLIASAASLTPQSFQASCMSAGAAWLVLWTIAKCYHLTTNRHGMGQGDIKLFAALGAWQGLDAGRYSCRCGLTPPENGADRHADPNQGDRSGARCRSDCIWPLLGPLCHALPSADSFDAALELTTIFVWMTSYT